MPVVELPIIRGEKITSDVDYTDFLPLNMTAVAKQIRGASGYMISHDGLELIASVTGEDRGGFYDDRRKYHIRIIGNTLYRVYENQLQDVGYILGSGMCSFSYSFNYTGILAGGVMHLFDGATIIPVQDPDIKIPLDQDWIDSYFFYTDGEYIYHSQINDEKLVDPLQFATAEIMPDKTVGVMRTSDNLMAVFGRYTIEYFINQGNAQFAFSRISQKSVSGGICGTHCKTAIGDTIFILGGRKNESPSIYALQSSMLEPLATRSIDKIIATYTEDELALAVLEGRTDKRDQFLIVRLLRHTLVLNLSAAQQIGLQNSWSQLSYGINLDPWLGVNGVFDPMQNAWVYGSLTGGVYRLSDKTAAQGGAPTEFELRTPILEAPSTKINLVEVLTVNGFSGETTAGLSLTTDGVVVGQEAFEIYSSVAEYDKRFMFWRIGYVPLDVSFRLRGVSANKVNFSAFRITYV